MLKPTEEAVLLYLFHVSSESSITKLPDDEKDFHYHFNFYVTVTKDINPTYP